MKNSIRFIILFLLIASGINAQSITNSLGSGGTFIVRDVTNIMNVNLSSGVTVSRRLTLSGSGSDQAIIFGFDRFIHAFQPSGGEGKNTFIGISSGNFNLTTPFFGAGSCNTGMGFNALNKLTAGYGNSAFGESTLLNTTTGANNSAFGKNVLLNNTTGEGNSGFGAFTLDNNTTGASNSAFGFNSLSINSTGGNNSAFGFSSLSNNNGSFNCAFGHLSLAFNSSGYSNTGLGTFTLRNNSTGFRNTAVGDSAGRTVTTGSNLTMIGYDALPSSATAINQITLGNNQITSLRCNVTSITSLSDARDKKNIQDLGFGISFIMALKPRQFNWDKREWYEDNVSDGSRTEVIPTAGFIAQELDEAQSEYEAEFLNLVFKNNPEKLEATYGNLMPVIVKALQELKQENDRLALEIEKYKTLEQKLNVLEGIISGNHTTNDTNAELTENNNE